MWPSAPNIFLCPETLVHDSILRSNLFCHVSLPKANVTNVGTARASDSQSKRPRDQTASALLTVEVGYPHQLEDSDDDQRVGGCKCVHQLQHVHPILSQTHTNKQKYYKRQFTASSYNETPLPSRFFPPLTCPWS